MIYTFASVKPLPTVIAPVGQPKQDPPPAPPVKPVKQEQPVKK